MMMPPTGTGTISAPPTVSFRPESISRSVLTFSVPPLTVSPPLAVTTPPTVTVPFAMTF